MSKITEDQSLKEVFETFKYKIGQKVVGRCVDHLDRADVYEAVIIGRGIVEEEDNFYKLYYVRGVDGLMSQLEIELTPRS